MAPASEPALPMKASPDGLLKLREKALRDWSTTKFKIQYDGYLANHLLHAVVALFELGATEQQIESYADKYATKLEVPENEYEAALMPEDAQLTTVSAMDLLGKRTNFYELVAFYEQEISQHGVDGAITIYLPAIVNGLVGSLFHGIIQLGYAYHIGGDRLIAEGLAYLHYSYVPFTVPEPLALGQTATYELKQQFTREAVMHLACSLAKDEDLQSELKKQLHTEPLKRQPTGFAMRKIIALSSDPECGSTKAFRLIQESLEAFDLSTMDSTFALDFVLWLYDMIKQNDFVVLHGVTSAWALAQVDHLLTSRDRQCAWKSWMHAALAAFVSQRVQTLSDYDFCDRMKTELTHLDSWDTILRKSVALEGFPDEHVYKLVHTAHDHATGDANDGFLSYMERDFVARSAASKVLSMPFTYPRPPAIA